MPIGRRRPQSPCCRPLPLEDCLAKTRTVDGESLPGRTVEDHCRIVGAAASELLHLMPECTRRLFPDNTDCIAAAHDLGKVFPHFQIMIHKAAGDLGRFSELAAAALPSSAAVPHHASVSRAALFGLHPRAAETAGRHHGRDPEHYDEHAEICGGPAWQERRRELLHRLLEGRGLPVVATDAQSRLITGLTVVADWIGSGALFDDPAQPWPPLVEQAVREAGFLCPRVVPGKSFCDIFGFAPNAVQEAAAQAVTGPGVHVLEAPMGVGKTEAALFAAYRMLEQGKARGLYFALPTQLTSNKIHERLTSFLRTVLAEDCRTDPLLLHSTAWLYATHHEEGEHASSWFERSKRGLLAPFGVGTLDQALMAVINVRHPEVRSFGLAGKVVVLDEVHSYDAYTGTLLDALVDHLLELNCTVIILSATLTRARLNTLIRCGDLPEQGYPLITVRSSADAPTAVVQTSCAPEIMQNSATVCLRTDADEAEALEEALCRAENGQQVLWMENTVREAQERYRTLAARAAAMHIETGLLHSRFTPSDRGRIEDRWTTLYGKNSTERAQCGRIFVGTQVLEQSLDLDGDFLVTRFCPTDLLFQRMGRLWRHGNTVRPADAQREAWILPPRPEDVQAAPDRAFGMSGIVYAPYVLARSLELWHGIRSVRLPADIRPFLEATYADRESEPSPAMLRARRNLEEAVTAMRRTALAGRSDGPQLSDGAATRFIEDDSRRILLVRSLDGRHCVLADGQECDLSQTAADQRRKISALLFANMVRVRTRIIPFPVPINRNAQMRSLFLPFLPVRENYEAVFLARIRPDDALEDLCAGTVGGRYTACLGWETEEVC